MITKYNVFVTMPRRPESNPLFEATDAYRGASLKPDLVTMRHAHTKCSILPETFNILWCHALNFREPWDLTHVAMIHDDVAAPPGWLDTMLAEMDKHNADMISAVIPLRGQNPRGETSTALETEDYNPWKPDNLTLRQVFGAFSNETFTHHRILLNTGLMVVRLNGKAWSPAGPPPHFEFTNKIEYDASQNKWVPRCVPEDWNFSRMLRAHGGRLYATRKVKLWHGRPECHNHSPWGEG